MSRVAQTEILCAYAPQPLRAQLHSGLERFHPAAVHTSHHTGWLIVESALGNPRSQFLGSSSDVRFLLGEENLVRDPRDAASLARLAAQVVNEPAAVQTWPGDFSIVVLSPGGRATAVRACGGNPRLFGFHHDGITGISTRLDWLARLFRRELSFDGMRLAIELSGLTSAPHCASVLQGLAIVPCGHVAHFGTWESPRIVPYWFPRTDILHRSTAEIAEVIEPELRSELRRHVDPETSTAVLLSGGLDSSLLWGMTARETKKLDAVTTLPPREHPLFQREYHFSQLAATGSRDHAVFTFTPESLVAHLRGLQGDLCPLGMEWLGLGALREAPNVVISGWFADECWGFLRLSECLRPWFPNLWHLATHAPFKRELFRFWFDRHRSGRFTFPPARAPYPEVLNRSFMPEFYGWLANTSWVPRPESPAEKLRLHRWLTDMTGPYAEAASYIGARAITPFTCRALVELSATCDPHALFRQGVSKAPLRDIAMRLLPRALAGRADKGDWAPLSGGGPLPRPNVEAVAPLLDTNYVADHPSLSLDDVWCIEWLNVLERGRRRVEHERKTIWR